MSTVISETLHWHGRYWTPMSKVRIVQVRGDAGIWTHTSTDPDHAMRIGILSGKHAGKVCVVIGGEPAAYYVIEGVNS